MEASETLRYPIGRFSRPQSSTQEERNQRIETFENLPLKLDKSLHGFTDEMYDTPYREGGWTIRQLIHHIADSHLNSFSRFKRTLTEDRPLIKGYDQAAWAEMSDAKQLSPDVSLNIIRGVHIRLTNVLRNMSEADFEKGLQHNEWENDLSLDDMLALYAWHSDHHLAHITNLKERKGW